MAKTDTEDLDGVIYASYCPYCGDYITHVHSCDKCAERYEIVIPPRETEE